MSEACLKKLESEWEACAAAKDLARCAKILRCQVNLLKSTDGLLSAKELLAREIEFIELGLPDMAVDEALPVIGHLRYARKTVAISSGEFGGGFTTRLSKEERARIRKRNRPPRLSIQNRTELGPVDAISTSSNGLRTSLLGNGEGGLA